MISLGREFRTSAVHSGADPVSQGHGNWAAMASSKGFGCVENTPQEVTGKATAGYETARMSAWACLRCSAHLLHWHSVVDASWMNGGARDVLLKTTELLSSAAKIINFVPRWVMYLLEKTIYASVVHRKKRERLEVAVSLFLGLLFIWFSLEICFFLLAFFFSFKKKVWTNGPSRCLGHLGAQLFICVGPIGLCAMCGPQILHTVGSNVLHAENRQFLFLPVLIPFSLCGAQG